MFSNCQHLYFSIIKKFLIILCRNSIKKTANLVACSEKNFYKNNKNVSFGIVELFQFKEVLSKNELF